MLHPPCALVAFALNLYQTQTQLETKCYQQIPLRFAFEALFSIALCLLELQNRLFMHLWQLNSSEVGNLSIYQHI